MKAITKTLFLATALLAGTLTSCTDYQDEIDTLDYRVTVLESLVKKTNEQIRNMQEFINAAAEGWVITGIVEVDADNDPEGVGYRTITFGKIDPATGQLSTLATDKKVVTNHNVAKGDPGNNATAPNLTLMKDPNNPADPNYYWWLGNNWLTDENGNKIQANGENGKSNTPLLDIRNGIWYISLNNGETWEPLLDNGQPISATGPKGDKGDPGEDAKSLITNVNSETDINGKTWVIFTLWNGNTIRIEKTNVN